MAKVETLYRDATNYKFFNTFEVPDDVVKKLNLKVGDEEVHVSTFGITEEEWKDSKYREGYKWRKKDDHPLVDIISIELTSSVEPQPTENKIPQHPIT